jgi:hypothetical protein
MPKYQITKNIKVIDEDILKVGDEIELTSESDSLIVNTKFGQLELPYKQIKDSIKLKKSIEFSVTPLEDEDEIRDYRLQLDIKTTRKRAKEIENNLREFLEKII